MINADAEKTYAREDLHRLSVYGAQFYLFLKS